MTKERKNKGNLRKYLCQKVAEIIKRELERGRITINRKILEE